jgi:Zn-dependent protease with chaperone function
MTKIYIAKDKKQKCYKVIHNQNSNLRHNYSSNIGRLIKKTFTTAEYDKWEVSFSTKNNALIIRTEQQKTQYKRVKSIIDKFMPIVQEFNPELAANINIKVSRNIFSLPNLSANYNSYIEAQGTAWLNDNILTAIIAHELSHLILRHPTQLILLCLYIDDKLQVLPNDIKKVLSNDIKKNIVNVQKFVKNQEFEADLLAMHLLKLTNLPQKYIFEWFNLLKKIDFLEQSKKTKAHPSIYERIENVKNHVNLT